MEEQDKKIIEEKLAKIYNDPNSPAAFAGLERLWQEAKKIHGIQKKHVRDFLEGHRTYSLMRPRRVNFPRSKTIAAGYMTDFQCDLAFMNSPGLSRNNAGYKYILVGIDVLSKQVFVIPLKTKEPKEMIEAFKKLIDQLPMKMHRLFTDRGGEFTNYKIKQFFEQEEIEKYESTNSSVKASICERAIRNIKNRLYRYFAQHNTVKWIDVIQKIADGINRSKSRVHGMRPIDVNFSNAQKVWKKMYGNEFKKKKRIKPKFKENDFVRMAHHKLQFEKGYVPNYSDVIVSVDKVKRHMRPIRYKLLDENNKKMKGAYYGEELTRVRKDADTTYRIEKVFRKRTKADGTKELLVKYIGYPEREWISENQLV